MKRVIKFRGKTLYDFIEKVNGEYEIPQGTFVYGSLVFDFNKNPLIDIQGYNNGIGIQKMVVAGCATIHPKFVGDCSVDCKTLAHNDGLSEVDWRNWFERYDLTEPLAVIHFTKFRYRYEQSNK